MSKLSHECHLTPPLCKTHFLAMVSCLTINEPPHEKTCLRGLRPGKTQIGLLNYRDKLES